MDLRIDTAAAARSGRRRAIDAWQPIALAAAAAAIAWLIAHRLLGHAQPFFAPIAAAIALSTSSIQRARRSVQMVTGVLLGIGIGEALAAMLGTSTTSLGVIVFVTMIAARMTGAGFFGQGMMFANQAAASAILVITLHRHGTGGERVLDAVVGGIVALVLGVGLFPADPLALLRDAERRVLQTLGSTLDAVTRRLGNGFPPDQDWTLSRSHEIHREVASLAQARATARANVRIAPRRWRLRSAVMAEDRRMSQLDLLANAVLGLVRASGTDIYGNRPLPSFLRDRLTEFSRAVAHLAAAPRPWPPELVRSVAVATSDVITLDDGGADRGTVVASVLRAAADDLTRVVGGTVSPARSTAWQSS